MSASSALTLPRLHGRGQQRIDYHHVIWSSLRKLGAFAEYRYRDELFPSLLFRCRSAAGSSAAASRSSTLRLLILQQVAWNVRPSWRSLLLESRDSADEEAVRLLVEVPRPLSVPKLLASGAGPEAVTSCWLGARDL